MSKAIMEFIWDFLLVLIRPYVAMCERYLRLLTHIVSRDIMLCQLPNSVSILK